MPRRHRDEPDGWRRLEIWINPACSKCQAATELLEGAGASYTVRRYLDDPPTADELDAVLSRLGLEPWDVARMSEPEAGRLGLAELPRERRRWLEVMSAHPILIQRPIITADDGTTVVGRSEEAVQSVLAAEQSAGTSST
jgi:arsenate reductase